MLIDTHAHLDQEDFDADRAEVIDRALAAGVETMLCIGTTAAASQKCAAIARQFEPVFAAVGIQPNYVAAALPGDWDRIAASIHEPKVRALGETGLDRHWDHSPFELQQEYFDRHLRLSQSAGLPFIVHMRDCEADIMAMLREAAARQPLSGVMHSFTGDEAMAAECVSLGLYISFAGMVTYKKSEALRACAASIPDDRLLIETDSPYLAPQPVRGQRRNEPAHLRFTAECLATARGQTLERLAQVTSENARRLFKF